MHLWTPYPFVRYTICLIAGIWYEKNWSTSGEVLLIGLLAVSLIYTLLHLITIQRRAEWLHNALGLLAIVFLILAGMWLTHSHNDLLKSTHFSHYTNKSPVVVKLRIADDPVEKEKFIRVKADVVALHSSQKWIETTGSCQLYIFNKPQKTALTYGSILIAKGTFENVPGPLNPDDFDYARYLSYQNIFHQMYLWPGRFSVIGHKPENVIKAWAYQLRNHAEATLKQHIPTKRELAITAALVLGIKDHLENPLRNMYAEAGATHLLAVSGLHVGLIYGLLLLLFKGIGGAGSKSFSVAQAFIALGVLWFYAFVTGLSPSVLRAVAMFSIMALGQSLNRQGNIFNTLALSAFLLLCFNPLLIYEVGFQLSYAAVAGIILIQPRLSRLVYFTSKPLKWAWDVLTVTTAAQVATAPFSIFYFQQFPVYFLLTNLFAIPLATISLYSGVVLAVLGSWPVVGKMVGVANFSLVWLMNELIGLEQQLPFNAIKGIALSKIELWLWYIVIALLCAFLFYKKLRWLWFAAVALLINCLVRCYYFWQATQQHKFIVYHIPGHRAVSYIHGRRATFLLSKELYANKLKQHYHFSRHWTNLRLAHVQLIDYEQMVSAKAHLILKSGQQNATSLTLIRSGYVWPEQVEYGLVSGHTSKAVPQNAVYKLLIVEGNRVKPIWKALADSIPDKIWLLKEKGAFELNMQP